MFTSSRPSLSTLFISIIFCILICHATGQDSRTALYGGDAAHIQEHRLRESLLTKYNVHVFPPHNASAPITVQLGFSLTSVRQLDHKTQILSVSGWVKHMWYDSRLQWDPEKYAGIKTLAIPDSMVWKPDVTLYNSAKVGETEQFGKVYTLVEHTGRVLWVRPGTLHAICPVDLQYYPYERHTCFLRFGSWVNSAYLLDFQLIDKKESIKVEYTQDGGEWTVVTTWANRTLKYYKCCKEPYPDVSFYMELTRHSPFYKATILCPVVTGLLLALASFLVPLAQNLRRTTLLGISFVALLATLIHLSVQLPAVGHVPPVIVVFTGGLLILVSLALIWNSLSPAPEGRTKPVPPFVATVTNSFIAKFLLLGASNAVQHRDDPSKVVHAKEENVLEVITEDTQKGAGSSKAKEAVPDIQDDWNRFYQLVDRLFFILFLLSLALVFIVAYC